MSLRDPNEIVRIRHAVRSIVADRGPLKSIRRQLEEMRRMFVDGPISSEELRGEYERWCARLATIADRE